MCARERNNSSHCASMKFELIIAIILTWLEMNVRIKKATKIMIRFKSMFTELWWAELNRSEICSGSLSGICANTIFMFLLELIWSGLDLIIIFKYFTFIRWPEKKLIKFTTKKPWKHNRRSYPLVQWPNWWHVNGLGFKIYNIAVEFSVPFTSEEWGGLFFTMHRMWSKTNSELDTWFLIWKSKARFSASLSH